MTDILNDLYTSAVIPFFALIPKLFGAIMILLLGIFIAKMIAKFIRRILEKSGVDKVKDMLDEIEMVNNANIQALPSTVLSKFVYYIVLLFVALMAASVLNIEEISQLIQDLIKLLPNLLVALLILVIGILLADALRNIVYTACKSIGIPAGKIVASFVFFFVFINALMISLSKATIPTDFLTDNLTVVLGGIVVAFAIGYGLASRDLMSNFLASLYTKGKFNIGDLITVEDISGEIMDIDSTSLTVLSDGKRVILPLSKLTVGSVTIHDKVN